MKTLKLPFAHLVAVPLAIALTLISLAVRSSADSPSHHYWVKLVCEASDRIATIRFGPDGATLKKTTETRVLQSDISGPHGIVYLAPSHFFFPCGALESGPGWRAASAAS